MNEQFGNTDRFNRLVDSLKQDLLIVESHLNAEHITHDVKDAHGLEAKIVAVTAQLNQYTSAEREHSVSKARGARWRSRFALPLLASMALGAAIFVFTPLATLPSKISPVSSSAVVLDQDVAEEAYLENVVFGQKGVAQVEADLAFQELWLTEDEWLFSEEI